MNIPETFFSTSEELQLFLLSCLAGAVLGMVFDGFRALRLIVHHNRLFVLLEDLAFLCGYAVFLSAFASAAAHGVLRFYFAVGNGLGFTVYFFTIGSFVLRTLSKVLTAVKKLLAIIFKPVRALYVPIRKKAGVEFVGSNKNLVKSIKKVSIPLQTTRKLLYNKKESTNRKNVNGFVQKQNKRKRQKSFKKNEQKQTQGSV